MNTLQFQGVRINATQSQIDSAISLLKGTFVKSQSDRYAEFSGDYNSAFYISRDTDNPKLWSVYSTTWTSSLCGATKIARMISKLTEKLYHIDLNGKTYTLICNP